MISSRVNADILTFVRHATLHPTYGPAFISSDLHAFSAEFRPTTKVEVNERAKLLTNNQLDMP